VPPLDATNIVRIASASPDHTTLVAALQAADYVTSVAASGPLTVFAPTDQAFIVTADTLSEDKIVSEEDAWKFYEGLGLTAVAQVLAYHVTEGVRNSKSVTSAKQVTMLDGGTITARDGFVEAAKSDAKFVKGLINVRVSDGMIHVIDNVLLP
jgi:uncharacterized surface protein with fasciclin (FAS1) repeats